MSVKSVMRGQKILLLLLMFSILGQSIYCGRGVPVLTRSKVDQYSYRLQTQCLCPIDYQNIQCSEHRVIKCHIQAKNFTPEYINQTNYKQNMSVDITFTAQCFIRNDKNFLSIPQFLAMKQLRNQSLQYELEGDSQSYEILWVNQSSLFDQYGRLVYQQGYGYTTDQKGIKRMSTQDQANIIYGNGAYKFNYQNSFLGIPMTDSKFIIQSKVYQALKNPIILTEKPLQFVNQNQYLNMVYQSIERGNQARSQIQNVTWNQIFSPQGGLDLNKLTQLVPNVQKLVPNNTNFNVLPQVRCSLNVSPKTQAEINFLKIQLMIKETYQKTTRIQHTSVNSAIVRVPTQVPGVGQPVLYNSYFYKSASRLWYLFGAIAAFGIAYGAYKLYTKWVAQKFKKVKDMIDQQTDDDELLQEK